MGQVIYGKFPAPVDDRPDWVVAAMRRHEGLSFKQMGGNGSYLLDGTPVILPNGDVVHHAHGYLRTTGQWRGIPADSPTYEVEVFCCKTTQSRWIPTGWLSVPRTIDDLYGLDYCTPLKY